MDRIKVELTLTEELLGTASANPEVYTEFIGSKRPDEPDPSEVDSLPTVEEELQKQTTVFHRTVDGKPMLYDYQIKGFFKDTCSALSRVKPKKGEAVEFHSADIRAYKKVIDGLVFVQPRKIPLLLPEGTSICYCTRPLRAQTAQGERIALARSETVPAGTKAVFDVVLLDPGLSGMIQEWLDYGQWKGLGCWRNSGKGRFDWKEIE